MRDDWKTFSKRFKWKQFDWCVKLILLFHFRFCFGFALGKCYHADTSNSAPLGCYLITILLIGVSSGSFQVVLVLRGVSVTTCRDVRTAFSHQHQMFLRHISCRIEFCQHPGELHVTQSTHATMCVCMFVSRLCLYLETGKVCRSKSLRKAALIPSSVASTWDGCKWTNGNQSPFIPPSVHRLPQTKGERCSAGS